MHLPDLTGVRRRLPRLPAGRRVAVVSVLLVAALAVALGYSVHTARVRARQQRVEQLLQAAVQARQEAGQQSNPAAAQAYLVAARARVQQAQASGLDQQRASQELAAIDAALDKALHVERLANLQVLGGVPAPAAGVTPRVFFGNGQVYVFTDALYRLDANGTSLVRLLAPGDQVGGAPVGALQGAAWGDGTPVAFDGSNAYVLDPTSGTWSRHALATLGAPYSGIASISGYSGNLYLLAPGSGQILKYAAGAFGQEPEDWTGGLAADDLRHATDMEIDGHIYVLLKDGRVLSFYRSALEKTIAPSGVTPAVEGAVALSEQPDRPYLYEADAHGRILRLTRDGKLVQQFMPAAGGPSLDHVRDIAVDDVTG
ncbi:MAG: hypothetical protein IRY97_10360, partial [Thermomicrobiaceae bacterium]|nr:hypothetical protein [Thermomicrobiaceae bacterium]